MANFKSYDLIVIGGGSAGYAAARTAASEGLKVAVIEGGKEVGGLCILRGCMPTKALLESAHRLHEIKRAKTFGLEAKKVSANWKRIVARKNRFIREFADYRQEQLEKGKFDFIRGFARFKDSHTLEVSLVSDKKHQKKQKIDETRLIKAKSFIVATGSSVALRELPGLVETGYITSDEAIHLTKPMKRMVVLGGGAVALEFAQYFSRLGVRVTLIQRSKHILSGQDEDTAVELENALRAEGIDVITETNLLRFTKKKKEKTIIFEHRGKTKKVKTDEILYALGRKPATEHLGLEAAGVEIEKTKGGRIKTRPTLQSNRSHIFAVGDCAGLHEVVHTAIIQGECAGRNAVQYLRKKRSKLEKMDYRLQMDIVFTHPEVATIGLTERRAQETKKNVICAKYPFNDHGKSLIMEERDGFVKLIADSKKGEILGAQIVGPHASDMIHEFAVAMSFRATVSQFLEIPHYHPTLAEIVTYPAEELAEEIGKE